MTPGLSDRPATRLVRVLVADDDPQVRDALIDLIGDDETLELVGAAADAVAAVDLARRMRPDVAVLDVRMPGGGVAAAQQIRRACPGTSVIALSSYGDRNTVAAMTAAGAVRFLIKGAADADLLATIADVVAAGAQVVGGQVAGSQNETVVPEPGALSTE